MNGALTIGTEDGANIEMREGVGDAWWPFHFGMTEEEAGRLRKEGYNPLRIYQQNPTIRRALDTLKDNTFAKDSSEKEAFEQILNSLLYKNPDPDYFMLLQDLPSYLEAQKKVEALFLQPYKWAEMALHNIGGMGKLSIDTTIQNYVDLVWKVEKCPMDSTTLRSLETEFTALDRCRIF